MLYKMHSHSLSLCLSQKSQFKDQTKLGQKHGQDRDPNRTQELNSKASQTLTQSSRVPDHGTNLDLESVSVIHLHP